MGEAWPGSSHVGLQPPDPIDTPVMARALNSLAMSRPLPLKDHGQVMIVLGPGKKKNKRNIFSISFAPSNRPVNGMG